MSVTYIDSQMGSDVDQTLYVKELMVEAKTYFETTLKVLRTWGAQAFHEYLFGTASIFTHTLN